MQQKKDQPSNITNFVIIGLIILSAYLLYSLTFAFYNNHQIDVHIENFEKENERIKAENEQLIEEFEYVTSESFIDKILKQNKGLINPGEEVIVIASENDILQGSDEFDFDSFGEKNIENLSNSEKWRIFIFEDNPFR